MFDGSSLHVGGSTIKYVWWTTPYMFHWPFLTCWGINYKTYLMNHSLHMGAQLQNPVRVVSGRVNKKRWQDTNKVLGIFFPNTKYKILWKPLCKYFLLSETNSQGFSLPSQAEPLMGTFLLQIAPLWEQISCATLTVKPLWEHRLKNRVRPYLKVYEEYVL